MIYVTRPFMPPLDELKSYLDKIYESRFLTNGGPLVQLLEERLAEVFQIKNVVLVSNGSAALQVAYAAAGLNGNAITTPFSFVATSSTLKWMGITPRFADIEEDTFNINPYSIECLVDENTSAIVATHVFGNPCNVNAIRNVAEKFGLKVIYDAAHTFGVQHPNFNLFAQGDVSAISFHATKIFSTIEGGAILTDSDSLASRARSILNFGYSDSGIISCLGINAKMNEFEAAFGLSCLNYVDGLISNRKLVFDRYIANLGGKLSPQNFDALALNNYAYAPFLFPNGNSLENALSALNANNIFPRRYFNPSLNTLFSNSSSLYSCPISEDISGRILCLPIYHDLGLSDVDKISEIVIEQIGKDRS